MLRCVTVEPEMVNAPLLDMLTSESEGVSVTVDTVPVTSVLSLSHFLYFVCEPLADTVKDPPAAVTLLLAMLMETA